MNESPLSNTNFEFDVLDFLVTIAENIKLLIFGPVFAGLVALLIVLFLPQTYQSSFTLHCGNEDLSPARLSQIILGSHTLSIAAKALESQGKANLAISLYDDGIVKASVKRNSTLVLVSVSSSSPESALELAQSVLEASLSIVSTQGDDMPRLKQTLEKEEAALANVRRVEALMSRSILRGDKPDPALTQNYAALTSGFVELSKRVDAQRARIARLSDIDVVNRPRLPEAAIKPNKALVVVASVIATTFLLLLFVFVRKALRNARTNPASAAKIDRIKKSISFYSK